MLLNYLINELITVIVFIFSEMSGPSVDIASLTSRRSHDRDAPSRSNRLPLARDARPPLPPTRSHRRVHTTTFAPAPSRTC